MRKLKSYIFHIDHWLITVFAFIILAILYALVFNLSVFYPVRRALGNLTATDFFFQLTNKEGVVNQDITIVDIKDEHSRANIAKCIAAVDSLKPWSIGIDITFDSITGSPQESKDLCQTAATLRSKVVWATKLQDYNNDKKAFSGITSSFFTDSLGLATGFTNLDDNLEHKTIRKMLTVEKLNGKSMNSFPLAMALQLGDSVTNVPEGTLAIDYGTSFTVVPWDSINLCKELIKDHVVLIGSTTDDKDIWHTPIGNMPGVMVQAYSLNTLRNHSYIRYYSFWINFLIAFILCYIFELLIDLGFQWLRKRNDTIGSFLIDSKLLLRLVTIIFMSIVTWIILGVFINHSIYFDAVLILASMGAVLESRRIYNASIKALSKKYNWWIIKNSLVNNNIFK